MWILAQNLPISETAEIVKQLDIVQSLVLLLILSFVIIGFLIFFMIRSNSQMSQTIKDVLDSDKEGDRHNFEFIKLLQDDFRTSNQNTSRTLHLLNEAIMMLRVEHDKDDTLGRKIDEINNVITASADDWRNILDSTKPIANELLDKLEDEE